MAKSTKKSATNKVLWQAHRDDAIRLAALRWFALTFERLAIQIYATDREKYDALTSLMKSQIKALASFGERQIADGEPCPEGYFLCADGLCAPMCDSGISAPGAPR